MYSVLLGVHSITRYFVLGFLVGAVLGSIYGLTQKKPFSKSYERMRYWTIMFAHLQLIIGVLLYVKSPITLHFVKNFGTAIKNMEFSFFALYHSIGMITAVVLLTIGAALVKRKEKDEDKFKTILKWFGIALIIIFIIIPWPFSPLANRPYIRPF